MVLSVSHPMGVSEWVIKFNNGLSGDIDSEDHQMGLADYVHIIMKNMIMYLNSKTICQH